MSNLGPVPANQGLPRTAIASGDMNSFTLLGDGQAPLPGNIVVATSGGLWLMTTFSPVGRADGYAPILINASLSILGAGPDGVAVLYYSLDGQPWVQLDRFFYNNTHVRQLAGQRVAYVTAGSHYVMVGWKSESIFGGSCQFSTACMGLVSVVEL